MRKRSVSLAFISVDGDSPAIISGDGDSPAIISVDDDDNDDAAKSAHTKPTHSTHDAPAAWAVLFGQHKPVPIAAKKPRGPTPYGKVWDGKANQVTDVHGKVSFKGEWVPDVQHNKEDTVETPPKKMKGNNGVPRAIVEEWYELLPWLILVSTLEKGETCKTRDKCPGCDRCARMHCSLCMERKTAAVDKSVKNSFGDGGCNSFRSISVSNHARNYHEKDMDSQQTSIVKAIQDANTLNREAVKKLIRCVYYLAKTNSPLSNIKDLCELHGLQGLSLGNHYTNANAARDLLEALATVVRRRIIQAAAESPCIAVAIDESTDISGHNHMVVFARVFMDGVFQTRFLRLLRAKDTTANGLLALVQSALEGDDIPIDLCESFASDGASAMIGRWQGVATQLKKKWNPYMQTCHCIAHRNALVCADAALDNLIVQFLEDIIHQILTFHSHSPQRKDKLHDIMVDMDTNPLQLIHLSNTRWLSRGNCVSRIHKCIPALYEQFRADEQKGTNMPIAGVLAGMVTSYKFMLVLTIFIDIYASLNLLSKSFQRDQVRYKEVMETIAAIKTGFRDMYLGEGACMIYMSAIVCGYICTYIYIYIYIYILMHICIYTYIYSYT
jgi:hypothetical protein